MKNGVPRDRYKNEKNLKFFDRDRFNSCRVFLVDDSGSKEDGKSKEALQCSSTSSVSKTGESPRETISNPFYNPDKSENQSSNEIIMGASFLVQIWEARSQQSSSSRSQSLIHSRTSSGFSLYEDSNSSSFSENNNDNNGEIDWCSQSDGNHVSDSYEEKEGCCFLQLVTCTPRIRGRKASEDFLMMIIRDREKELDWLADRYAVSKFSPRRFRRLQYMLRIQNMERCIAIQERHRKKRVKKPVLSEVAGNRDGLKKPEIGRKATEEKERSRETMEKAIVNESLETNKTSLSIAEKVKFWDFKEKTNERKPKEKASNESKTARRIIDVEAIERTKDRRKKEQVSIFEQGKSMENEENGISFQEIRSLTSEKGKEEETTSHQPAESGKEERSSQDDEETSCLSLRSPLFLNGWDENETENEEYGDYSDESVYYDWVREIARPPSYWDGLRKQRELEITNNDSKKDEIQILIQRTVSRFLASHFREKIEFFFISHAQRRFQEDINLVDEEKENREESLVECSAGYQAKLEEKETEKERR